MLWILIVGIGALVVWFLWEWIVRFLLLGMFLVLAEMSMMFVALVLFGVGYGVWSVAQWISNR